MWTRPLCLSKPVCTHVRRGACVDALATSTSRGAQRHGRCWRLQVLACISTTWSVQPTVTLRRSVSLLAATMIAIYIGERYSIKAFARLLAQTMCLMMMLVLALLLGRTRVCD